MAMIRKGTVAFHLAAPVGLFAISPMKNRRMPLPSRLGTAACADDLVFFAYLLKTKIGALF